MVFFDAAEIVFADVAEIRRLGLVTAQKSGAMTTKHHYSSIEISECEVEHYLNNLDTSKAYDPDGIPPRLLKECSKEISSSLCSFFSKSIETGPVPRV